MLDAAGAVSTAEPARNGKSREITRKKIDRVVVLISEGGRGTRAYHARSNLFS